MAVKTLADADQHRRPATRPISRARRRAAAGRTSRLTLAGLVVAAVLLAGCSASSGPGGGVKPVKVALTFKAVGFSGKSPAKWILTCDPAGGTHAHAAAACAALLPMHQPFAPHPKGIACPMILRSDRKIIVTGTWFGVKVHRVVTDGGCDMRLFSKLDRIFN